MNQFLGVFYKHTRLMTKGNMMDLLWSFQNMNRQNETFSF